MRPPVFLRLTFVLLLLGGLGGCAGPRGGRIAGAVPAWDVRPDAPLALEGYDVVAYFTLGQPTRGTPDHRFVWQEVEWRFATAAHLLAFVANPQRYAPQYGGYCAYAASIRSVVSASPRYWAVVDDKLYLNANALAQGLWKPDRKARIQRADAYWPEVPRRPVPPAGAAAMTH